VQVANHSHNNLNSHNMNHQIGNHVNLNNIMPVPVTLNHVNLNLNSFNTGIHNAHNSNVVHNVGHSGTIHNITTTGVNNNSNYINHSASIDDGGIVINNSMNAMNGTGFIANNNDSSLGANESNSNGPSPTIPIAITKPNKGKVQTKEIVELYAIFRYVKDALDVLGKSAQQMNKIHHMNSDQYRLATNSIQQQQEEAENQANSKKDNCTPNSKRRKVGCGKAISTSSNPKKISNGKERTHTKTKRKGQGKTTTKGRGETKDLRKNGDEMFSYFDKKLSAALEEDIASRRKHTRQLFRCTSYIKEQLAECETLIAANYPERRLASIAIKAGMNVKDLLSHRRYEVHNGVGDLTAKYESGISNNKNLDTDGGYPPNVDTNTMINGVSINVDEFATNGHDGTSEPNSSGSKYAQENSNSASIQSFTANNEKPYGMQICTQEIPIPKPVPVKNKSLRFSPLDAVRIIAHNNLSDGHCNLIIDSWVARQYIPVTKDTLLKEIEKYYYGACTMNNISWDDMLRMPLLVPLDSRLSPARKERLKLILDCIKGVAAVDACDISVLIQRRSEDSIHTKKLSTTDIHVENLVAEHNSEVEGTLAGKDTATTGLHALAAGASLARPLAAARMQASLECEQHQDLAVVNDGKSRCTNNKTYPSNRVKLINLAEAKIHHRYKLLFNGEPLVLKTGQIPGPLKNEQFKPLEAIGIFMVMPAAMRDFALDIWTTRKWIPMEKKEFQLMFKHFEENSPVPEEWVSDWKADVQLPLDEEKAKKIEAALGLIKEGTVPIPPYPREEFTPLEVAVILSKISCQEKSRMLDVWIQCGFVPVGKKSLAAVTKKYIEGKEMPSRFGMYGRNRHDGTEKKYKPRKKGDITLPKSKKKEYQTCGAAGRAKQREAKNILIRNMGESKPPDGRQTFTPIEAVKALDEVPSDIRRYVAEQWIEKKYIPIKRTALYGHYRAYRDGKDPPKEWHSSGRPSKIDVNSLISWAKETSKQKGSRVTEDDVRSKVTVIAGSLSRKSLKTYWSCVQASLDMDSTVPPATLAITEPTIVLAAPEVHRTTNHLENTNQLPNQLMHMHQFFGYHEDISQDDVNVFL